MMNLLFDTPWWLPTLLAGCGIILFWNANRRQEARLRNIGLILAAAAIALIAVSWLVDTDLENCVADSKRLAHSVEKQDWPAMKAILAPSATVSISKAYQIYTNRDEIINGAQDAVATHGLENIRILSTRAEQTGSLITVTLTVLSDHRNVGRTINTVWQLEWQQSGKTWSLVRITCMQIGQLTGEAAGAQFPRPR